MLSCLWYSTLTSVWRGRLCKNYFSSNYYNYSFGLITAQNVVFIFFQLIENNTKIKLKTGKHLFTPLADRKTYPCGTFGEVGAKLRRTRSQHHSTKERMGDDLDGSGRKLLLLLLARQLHHLLHETHPVLCCYCAHSLSVGATEWERRQPLLKD